MQAPAPVQIIQNIVPHLGTQATSLEKVLRTLCAKIETLESYINAMSNGVTEMDQRLRTIAHNIEGSTEDTFDAGSVIHFPLERKLSERASSNVVDNIFKKFGAGTKVRHHRHRHHAKFVVDDAVIPDMSGSRKSAPAVEPPRTILEEARRRTSSSSVDAAALNTEPPAAAPEIATPAAVVSQTALEGTPQVPSNAPPEVASNAPAQVPSEPHPQAAPKDTPQVTPQNPSDMVSQVVAPTDAPVVDATLGPSLVEGDDTQAAVVATDAVNAQLTEEMPVDDRTAPSALEDNAPAAPTTAPLTNPPPPALDEAAMATDPSSVLESDVPRLESAVAAPHPRVDPSEVESPLSVAFPLQRSQTVPPMHMDAQLTVGLVLVRTHSAPKVAHIKAAPVLSVKFNTTPQTTPSPAPVPATVTSPKGGSTTTGGLPRVRSKQGSMRRLPSSKRNTVEVAPRNDPPLQPIDPKSEESGSDSYSDDDVDVVYNATPPSTTDALSREEIARRKALGQAAWEKLRKKQFLLTKVKGNILTTKKKDVFTVARRLEMLEKHSKELFAGSKQFTLEFQNTIADLTTRVRSELAAKADATSLLFLNQLQNDAERSIRSLMDDIASLKTTKADLSAVEAKERRTKDAIDKLTKDLESLQRKLGVMSVSYGTEFASLEARQTTLEEAILHHKAKEDGICIARCLSCHKEVTENPAEKSDDEDATADDPGLLKKINPSVYRSNVPLHATLQHLETATTEAPASPGPFRPLNLVAGKKVLKARPGTAPIRAKGNKKPDT
ncbi:hypothetical protein SDRG_14629 [Saprolegnia diclina VS20]|uniref:Uncharacterized protein n=1 Tax=Saprolegnia diclina (strain VS20) TaxID=1156394 RepID=T0Q2G0_SAPDV|nr:hypothetical protein SDRG_14629 [Saprolegnia diclina VS20]EQC27575.1 hypothetical protein SDRG_14629 [Saprolegnia diclina VS20]|eukprot:XP_008618995.1 hypothetical protein SDRG_14629 [Saprolegnia diclina VS20]